VGADEQVDAQAGTCAGEQARMSEQARMNE
jgi:hypothetical protein